MTTYASQKYQCSVCGTVSEFKVLASTNSFGYPDLDLRPAPMQRWTMDAWIQECPECGYAANEISDRLEISPEFLKSEEYRSCDGLKFKSGLAVLFYRQYMIRMKSKFSGSAFDAVLHAAWCCDDADDPENARHCRELAIPLLTKDIESEKAYLDDIIAYQAQSQDPDPWSTNIQEKLNNMLIMKADLLRRAGQFDRLITEYENVRFSEPLLEKILAFEIEKAKQQDTNRYTVRDAAAGDPQ